MESRFEIREAGTAELAEIASLEKVCFENDPWSILSFEEAMKNDSCKIYALFDMQLSKIVGYSVIITAMDQADLANIAVSPEWRKMGLGGTILEYTVAKAAEMGAFEVFLEVRASNSAALAMYEKYDFIKIGTRRNYYRHPREDAVIMVRKINEDKK